MKSRSSKTEIRVAVDSNYLHVLEKKLGISEPTDLARIALSLLDWASEETKNGRLILSTNHEGKDARRLVMPELKTTDRSTG